MLSPHFGLSYLQLKEDLLCPSQELSLVTTKDVLVAICFQNFLLRDKFFTALGHALISGFLSVGLGRGDESELTDVCKKMGLHILSLRGGRHIY